MTRDPAPLGEDEARELQETLERRRLAIDQTMWQAPGLSITAQAFLYVVALNPGTPEYGRIVVLIAGLLVVLAAAFSLMKQRYLEELHSEVIQRCRRILGLQDPFRRNLEALRDPRPATTSRPGKAWRRIQDARGFQDLASFAIWAAVLLAFALGDVILIVGTLADW
jgi:hypothetical protein